MDGEINRYIDVYRYRYTQVYINFIDIHTYIWREVTCTHYSHLSLPPNS